MEFWHFGVPSVKNIEAMAKKCEDLDFNGLTLTDSQNLSNETYIALTLAARATTKLMLGPGVTNPLTRHAAVTASAIATLQELSEGRAILGIGRGDSSLFNIGHKPVPPRVFQTYIEALQIYLNGGSLDANGYESQLKWLESTNNKKVPIDVAATGPKIIGIGALTSERVSLALGADVDRLAWGVNQIEQSISDGNHMINSKPSLGAYLNICVHEDVEKAAELVRPGVGIFAHFTGMSGANRDHVNQADQSTFDKLGSNYDKNRHGRGDATHAQEMSFEFIDRFSVIGPPEVCIKKLNVIKALGIERISVIGPRPDHFGAEADKAQERFAADIIPAFRG